MPYYEIDPFFTGLLLAGGLSAPSAIGQDTSSINRSNDRAFAFWQINPDSAELLAKQNLKNATAIDYWQGIGNACNTLGLVYCHSKSDTAKGYDYFRQAIAARRHIGDSVRIAGVLSNWADAQRTHGDYVAALKTSLLALKIMQDPLSPTFGAMSPGERSRRLGYLQLAISKIYGEEQDTVLALQYARDGLASCRQSGNQVARMQAEFNMAQQFFVFGDTLNHFEDSAVVYYRRLLVLPQASGFGPLNFAKVYHNLALILIHRADPADAAASKALLDSCNAIYQIAADTTGLGAVLIQRAHWLENFTGDLAGAIRVLENVWPIFDYLEPEKQLEMRLFLADLYQQTGKYARAADLLLQAYAQNDSLRNEATPNQIRKLEKQQYELDEYRRETLIQQQKIKIRNISLLAILLTIAGAITWLYFRHSARKKRTELFHKLQTTSQTFLEEVRREERYAMGTELHGEIATPLASLAWLTETLLAKTAADHPDYEMIEMLHRFLKEKAAFARDKSHALRAGLANHDDQHLNLDFKQHITNLCNLISGNIRTAYRIETDNPPPAVKFHLGHVIQELITNTLKYAKATSLNIQINQTGSELHLHYSDNGVGLDKNKTAVGVGMEDIARRVRELNGRIEKMGDREGGGFYIDIIVPLPGP